MKNLYAKLFLLTVLLAHPTWAMRGSDASDETLLESRHYGGLHTITMHDLRCDVTFRYGEGDVTTVAYYGEEGAFDDLSISRSAATSSLEIAPIPVDEPASSADDKVASDKQQRIVVTLDTAVMSLDLVAAGGIWTLPVMHSLVQLTAKGNATCKIEGLRNAMKPLAAFDSASITVGTVGTMEMPTAKLFLKLEGAGSCTVNGGYTNLLQISASGGECQYLGSAKSAMVILRGPQAKVTLPSKAMIPNYRLMARAGAAATQVKRVDPHESRGDGDTEE